MRENRKDDDNPTGKVIEEDPKGARRFVLRVSLKDLFAVRTLQRFKFVGAEARVTRILLQVSERPPDYSRPFLVASIELRQRRVRIRCAPESKRLVRHLYVINV